MKLVSLRLKTQVYTALLVSEYCSHTAGGTCRRAQRGQAGSGSLLRSTQCYLVPSSAVDCCVPITVAAQFSPAETLGSWAGMLLKAWLSVCVYSVFVLYEGV
jgi:hypothetical protein